MMQVADICMKNLRSDLDLTEHEIYFYKRNLATSYNVLGINADDAGDYSLALDYYYKSRWISEDIGDEGIIGGLLNNIGLIHEKQGDPDLALDFYRKSLEIEDRTEDQEGIVNALNKIGSIYLQRKEHETALDYFKRSVKTAKQNDLVYLASMCLGNVGVAFERLEMHDSALFYYEEAKIQMAEMGDWDGLSNVNYNIGMIYIEDGVYVKAISYCREGLRLAKEHQAKYRETLNCDCLYHAFKGMGRSDSSLFYYEIADTLQQSFDNKELTRELAQKEISFVHQQERYQDSLEHENEIAIQTANREQERAESQLTIVYLGGGLILLFLIGLIIYTRLSATKKQKEAIEEQADLTRKQKEIIEEQKLEIDQSIAYAELIQKASLPTKDHNNIFNDSFLLYLPKDIVSGDFYWLEEDEEYQYFSVADCTGHGIPGAFISMIGTILLNEIYNSKNIRKPGDILDELNRLIQLTLLSKEGQLKDGMDMSFGRIRKSDLMLDCAGANNPVWIISSDATKEIDSTTVQPNMTKGQFHLYEVKADKQPVGKYHDHHQPFTPHEIQLSQGDQLFLFSDGYADQFGGPKGKKFKYKPFKELLLSQFELPLNKQNQNVLQAFKDWKGSYEQIDDVCILSVKV